MGLLIDDDILNDDILNDDILKVNYMIFNLKNKLKRYFRVFITPLCTLLVGMKNVAAAMENGLEVLY